MGFMNFLKGLFTPAFLRRLGGAGVSALADGGLEALFLSDTVRWTGKFPFIETINPLPPLDDWLVLGGSMVTWLLASWKSPKPPAVTTATKIKEVGEGMTLYAVGMILHHTIIRAAAMLSATPAAAAAAAREVPATLAERLARKGYTPTKAVQLRNGRYTPTISGRLGYTPTA